MVSRIKSASENKTPLSYPSPNLKQKQLTGLQFDLQIARLKSEFDYVLLSLVRQDH